MEVERSIWLRKKTNEWATTKQACKDELVVYLSFFLAIYPYILYISMKVSVQLPGNSANTVCLTSEKGKVARQQQVVRQAGVRGNLQLLCN